MCLAAFAINASARWPLVIASNRDEFFDRPALPLARWQTASGRNIISGRDVLAGGTWLGMTPGGRVALLTNVRELSQAPGAKSRGELVIRWLEGDLDADQFMAQTDSSAYGGFNLVLGDVETGRWIWLSNRRFDAAGSVSGHRPQHAQWACRELTPGIYGLSNAALDTPWNKTLVLRAALKEALGEALVTSQNDSAAILEDRLWAALSNRARSEPGDLPDTGLPTAVEEVLSSAFVADASRGYGTRCSSLLIADAGQTSAQPRVWDIRLDEKTYLRPGADGSAGIQAGKAISQLARWKP